jgi:hydroxymethylglutaryl-CoA synthase
MKRAQIDPHELRAVWVGSESHPYAVKPTSTLVAEAIGAVPNTQAADWEFACKAGTEALVAAMGLVGSGMGHYAMAIGMDTAQGKPGDALEYTAGAGGAAYILGPAEESLAVINAAYSYVTDTPDFWRREYQKYPEHGMRFTGEPAYFKHITEAATHMMEAYGTTAKDYNWAVFHQPNTKFPQRVAGQLGFTKEQIETGLLVPVIGNTYAGAAVIGLTAILDRAQPGDRVLMVSFGSGAGSDGHGQGDRTRRAGNENPGIHCAPHGDRLRDLCSIPRKAGDEIEMYKVHTKTSPKVSMSTWLLVSLCT